MQNKTLSVNPIKSETFFWIKENIEIQFAALKCGRKNRSDFWCHSTVCHFFRYSVGSNPKIIREKIPSPNDNGMFMLNWVTDWLHADENRKENWFSKQTAMIDRNQFHHYLSYSGS